MTARAWLILAVIALVVILPACLREPTPMDPGAPLQPPTNVSAVVLNESVVQIDWEAPSTGPTPTGYIVAISEKGSDEANEYSSPGMDATSRLIDGLVEAEVYEVVVFSVNDDGRSAGTVPIEVMPKRSAPRAPTELMATSISASEVGLKWVVALDTVRTGYRITVSDGSSESDISISDPNSYQAIVSGLVNGQVYSFTVHALNDTAVSESSPTIQWAPAQRYTGTLRLYETSSEKGPGIELPDLDALNIAAGDKWDICLDTRYESLDIGSPTVSSYTDDTGTRFVATGLPSRKTLLGKAWTNVASLDDVYESADLTSETLEEALYNFNAQNTAGAPFAFVVKTESGNFAKVLVKAVGGKLLQGTAPDRFVELEVSYQSGADVPYAVTAKQDGPKWKKVNNSAIGEKKAQ